MDYFENRVCGIEPFTLLDFKNNIAAILFYSNCNIRCPYCYNTDVVLGKRTTLYHKDIIDFLEKRQGKLDGIVFSGGECTLHGENLIKDITFVKNKGYKVKLDTNGINFNFIKTNINLFDYIALDIKAPKSKSNIFYQPTQYNQFLNTLKFLIENKCNFEIRTTVHCDIINENDINLIIQELEELNYTGNYYIQFYFPTEKTLGNVSNSPRKFDIDKVKKSEKITVNYRNIESNTNAR